MPGFSDNFSNEKKFANDTDLQDTYAKQHLQGMYSYAFYKLK